MGVNAKVSWSCLVLYGNELVLSFFVENLISFYDNLDDLDCSTANIFSETALEEAHRDILKFEFKIFWLLRSISCLPFQSSRTLYGVTLPVKKKLRLVFSLLKLLFECPSIHGNVFSQLERFRMEPEM